MAAHASDEHKNPPRPKFLLVFFSLLRVKIASVYESGVIAHWDVSISGRPSPKSASLGAPAWRPSGVLWPFHIATLSGFDHSRKCHHDHSHDGCPALHEEVHSLWDEVGRL